MREGLSPNIPEYTRYSNIYQIYIPYIYTRYIYMYQIYIYISEYDRYSNIYQIYIPYIYIYINTRYISNIYQIPKYQINPCE